MVGCNWCGTTEVKLAENKPYCLDCACNCKRECIVCHKTYPNLKFYEKDNKRCNSCQSHYIAAKTKNTSIENNHRKFGDTTAKQKQYVSNEESASSGEEKRRRRRKIKMNMKLKMMIMIALMEELKKKIIQMKLLVKPRMFKKLLLPTSKKTIDSHGDFANK